MKAFRALLKSEIQLTIRDVNTLFFGVGFAVVLALVLGILSGGKPAFEGASYTFLDQSFGGIASIGIAATGLMGVPLVLADYREKKILMRFQVTPVSPGLLLLVQFVINLLVSVLSLVMVYLTCSLLFGYRMIGPAGSFLLSYFLVLFSMYSIGMLLASVSKDIKRANLLCSVAYFPMLLVSGATLPYEVMPGFMQKASNFLPLTQGIKLLKGTSLGLPLENTLLPVIVMLVLAVLCTGFSIRLFRWE